jgi:hypothetical protein
MMWGRLPGAEIQFEARHGNHQHTNDLDCPAADEVTWQQMAQE